MPSFKLRLVRALAPACLVLAGGCASITTPSGDKTPAAAVASRPYHDEISMSGRISAQYQENDKDQALHGSFEWTQAPAKTTVTLLSPLGQTLAVIEVTPEYAVMTQAGKPPRSAADVDRLAVEVLGWPLPVSGLRNWLQGFGYAAGGKKFSAYPQGPESFSTSDGWQLRYATWEEDGQSARPRRIDLKRSTSEAGDVSIRIVIDNWQAH